MSETAPRSNRRSLAVAIVVVVLLLPFAYSLVSPLFARADVPEGVFLEPVDPRHESCVEDTAYMRYHHWELLRQIREEVVRDGIRGDVGLKTCRECHTSRERFCNQCHNAVSLYPDCYGCHYYP